ncbi:MAG TPA: ABC transporter permease [Bacillota bacterium]|nr:ABC transporter permease [Bacillota bacterium]
MRALLTLTRALVRTTVRNRQGFFWTLFFPVVIMLVFGLIGNGGGFSVNLAVAGPAGGATDQVVAAFSQVPIFKVVRMDAGAAMQAVRSGKEDALLVVPAGTRPLALTLYYNDANYVAAQQAVAAVESSVSALDLALSGHAPALTVAATPVSHSQRATFLDFLVPGIVALMIMQNALFSVGAGLTRWKEQGILRRFLATPLRPVQFLGAVILNNLVVSLASLAIVVLIAVDLLHAHVAVPVAPLLAVAVVGIAVFLAIAFLVAGLSRSQEATIPIINLITFPMMFLCGIFFPVSTLPPALATIVGYLPLTYLANAIRALMSGQAAGFTPAVTGDLLGLLAWLAAGTVISARTWRWE